MELVTSLVDTSAPEALFAGHERATNPVYFALESVDTVEKAGSTMTRPVDKLTRPIVATGASC